MIINCVVAVVRYSDTGHFSWGSCPGKKKGEEGLGGMPPQGKNLKQWALI